MSSTTWLPNLVAGVSIWKLARDLNEPKFMDGRLLVPETEGSESLPSSVTWDVARLLPFKEAREKHAQELEVAVKDFGDALSRVADEFRKETSGYHQYKEAFTVPSIEADDGAHYFFDPLDKKLYVTNWGATPRAITGYQEFVFGWDRFGKAMAGAAGLAAAVAAAKGIKAGADAAKDQAAEDKKKEEEKKKEDDKKKRPIWFWILLVLFFLGLLALLLWLLHSCEEPNTPPIGDAAADVLDGSDASDAPSDGPSDAADASDGSDAADAGDARADGGDAGDAGKDGGIDGGKDGGKDAGDDDDDDDDDLDDDDGSGSGSGSGGGGGGGGGGGKGKVTVGPAGGAKGGPHRVHVHPQATEWRITQGWGKVSRTVNHGKRFDVYLGKGNTYDGVRVEYKDAKGVWHAF